MRRREFLFSVYAGARQYATGVDFVEGPVNGIRIGRGEGRQRAASAAKEQRVCGAGSRVGCVKEGAPAKRGGRGAGVGAGGGGGGRAGRRRARWAV